MLPCSAFFQWRVVVVRMCERRSYEKMSFIRLQRTRDLSDSTRLRGSHVCVKVYFRYHSSQAHVGFAPILRASMRAPATVFTQEACISCIQPQTNLVQRELGLLVHRTHASSLCCIRGEAHTTLQHTFNERWLKLGGRREILWDRWIFISRLREFYISTRCRAARTCTLLLLFSSPRNSHICQLHRFSNTIRRLLAPLNSWHRDSKHERAIYWI